VHIDRPLQSGSFVVRTPGTPRATAAAMQAAQVQLLKCRMFMAKTPRYLRRCAESDENNLAKFCSQGLRNG
jgi:hypothetical protein